jgi:hypothetical protein
MFRKLLLSSAASLALAAPLAVAPTADAHEARHDFRYEHRHFFRVYYRDPCRPGWVFAGGFGERAAAWRFAEQFRCRGFTISIR